MDMFSSMLVSLPIADMADAFWDSTLPGKAIVLVLFLGSAIAWTVMRVKWTELQFAMKKTEVFLKAFRSERNPIALFVKQDAYLGTPLNTIYEEGCHALEDELKVHGVEFEDVEEADPASGACRCLSLHQLEALRAVVDRNVADSALELEGKMGVLAIAVSAAPFVGLLGTVWGVMDAFSGMAEAGNAALSAVAPGISGALLTTIVGLLVALPSMVGYNLITAKIRHVSVQMDNFSQEFISAIQYAYVSET